jgi:hypothetical protein
MRSVEVTVTGNLSVADQLADMGGWCEREGIGVTDLHAVRILAGRVTFGATFERAEDADRFVKTFDGPG